MAGDWIKMRVDLHTDPAVIIIAEATGLDEDTVVGKLHRAWSWVTAQSRDGNARGVTALWLDRYLCVQGFAQAMDKAGWLTIKDDGLEFPNFDRHMSQPAKARALAAKRQVTLKSRRGNAQSVTKALPEKRREELIIPPKSPSGDFSLDAPDGGGGVSTVSDLHSKEGDGNGHDGRAPRNPRKQTSVVTVPETLPDSINTPDVRQALQDWLQHRGEIRKKVTPLALTKTIVVLAEWGPQRSVAAIEHSIANGWQGIIEPTAGRRKEGTDGRAKTDGSSYTPY